MTMNPQPCRIWLSITAAELFVSARISQRTLSTTAETHMSLPAPKRS